MYIILLIEDLSHIQVVLNEDGSTRLFTTKIDAEEFEDGINDLSKIIKL